MQLHCLLADEAAGASRHFLGCGNRATALCNVNCVHFRCGEQSERARLLQLDEHVHRTMLQGLKSSDRLAELLAGFQILDGGRMQCIHDSDRLRAQRGHGPVKHRVNDGHGLIERADHRLRPQFHTGELQVERARAVKQRILLAAEIFLVCLDDEQADPARIPGVAAGARRDDEFVRHRAMQNQRLLAFENEVIAVTRRACADVPQIETRCRFRVGERHDQ